MCRTLDSLLRAEGFTALGHGRWTYHVGGHVLEVMVPPWGGMLFAVFEAAHPAAPLKEWHDTDARSLPSSVTLGKAWLYLLAGRHSKTTAPSTATTRSADSVRTGSGPPAWSQPDPTDSLSLSLS